LRGRGERITAAGARRPPNALANLAAWMASAGLLGVALLYGLVPMVRGVTPPVAISYYIIGTKVALWLPLLALLLSPALLRPIAASVDPSHVNDGPTPLLEATHLPGGPRSASPPLVLAGVTHAAVVAAGLGASPGGGGVESRLPGPISRAGGTV
jgi:hypothetical protein